MKFLTDWRRPEDRDDILWIEDDFKDGNNPLDSDSRETWPTENINDPPDKGWGFVDFDRAEHTPPEIPEYMTDLISEDPEDVLWIDDDPPHDETISGIFSSEPSTSPPFTASSSLVTLEETMESEGILLAAIIFFFVN